MVNHYCRQAHVPSQLPRICPDLDCKQMIRLVSSITPLHQQFTRSGEGDNRQIGTWQSLWEMGGGGDAEFVLPFGQRKMQLQNASRVAELMLLIT